MRKGILVIIIKFIYLLLYFFIKKQLISRINRINGQVDGIKRMVETDVYCNDILIQIVAAEKSLKSLANLMFENHIYRCISNDISDEKVIDELRSLFKRFNN